ncbi:serine hydrolase domain-containing protein [Flavobacterium macacae]|uniref:Class A beta-lactamase-related serine hydrolase n=1 Tax=Flavobacterium macacae TaxID=2488993 RepID=A0A3P3W1N0_9FLAO|nr:serine hydrolase domain-containing protein [Flavobacterium macacae]RRJ88880.1 class A beta-lactamase-related serine hydrolase [Flavobacterium macacae]
MKFPKYIYIPLLASALFLGSCKEKEKNIASHETEIIDSDALSPYKIKDKKLDPKYIEDKKKSLDLFFEKNWPNNSMNGSFLVAKNGKIIYEKYEGKSNFSTDEKINSTTPIHVASVTKVLTATAVLRLVDREKLSLEDKVNKILPSFPYEEITIKMLLNHRSGLPNYAYFADDTKVWERSKMLHNQDILDLLAKHKFGLYFKPDRKFGYCNTNYAILALVIEKVTGKNYRTAMKEMIFEPLGMKNTFVFDYEKHKDTASQSYKGNKVLYENNHLDDVYGDKNVYSTPRDLLKFDMATYSDQFLNSVLVSEAFKGYSYEHKGTKNYGLGIRMLEWETGEKLYYHNGWWHGNTSSYVKLKTDTVAIIALSNKYTLKTYKVWKLAPLFGQYPIKLDKDDVTN